MGKARAARHQVRKKQLDEGPRTNLRGSDCGAFSVVFYWFDAGMFSRDWLVRSTTHRDCYDGPSTLARLIELRNQKNGKYHDKVEEFRKLTANLYTPRPPLEPDELIRR